MQRQHSDSARSASRQCSPPTPARMTSSIPSRKSASKSHTPARRRRMRSWRLSLATPRRMVDPGKARIWSSASVRAGRSPTAKQRVAVPVKLGFSLKDYYELSGEDEKFGYVVGGVLFTVPFARREGESARRRRHLRTWRGNEGGEQWRWRPGDRIDRPRVHVLTQARTRRI